MGRASNEEIRWPNSLSRIFGIRKAPAKSVVTPPLSAPAPFFSPPLTNTISGTLFDAGGSPITGGRTIKLIQNGTVSGTTATTDNVTGIYTFTGLTLANNDQISVFIAGAAEKGTTCTIIGSSIADITNFDLKDKQLTVRTDDGGATITNTNLAQLDSSHDTDIPFAYSGGAVTTTDGTSLQINFSSTYTPGGAVNVGGDWTNNGTFTAGSNTVAFNGTGAQTITTGGSGATKQFAGFTINKAGGTATLAGDLKDTALNIASGTFDQGASFNVTSGAVTVGANGTWTNIGTGDLTLSGDVSNSGTVNFNANGTPCGDNNDILIRSSVTNTARTWSGTGTFSMIDVDVQDQKVPGGVTPPIFILVNSGTNSGGNTGWTFVDQCTSGTYTWIGGTAGAATDWTVGTNWNPTRVAQTGDILIFDYDSTPSPTVTNVPNQTVAAIRFTNADPINRLLSVTLNAGADGNQLTLNGSTAQGDLSIPSGTALTLDGGNALKIQVSGANEGSIGGQLTLQNGQHRLIGAVANAITFSSGSIFTTAGTFSGNPFGTGTNGSVILGGGSSSFFGAGGDPFGGDGHSVATIGLAPMSSQEFSAASALSTNGRSYGNLTLNGSQTYTGSGSGVLTISGNFDLKNGSTLQLSGTSGGNLNLLGNFADESTSSSAFDPNGRTVLFQGGSSQQQVSKASGAETFYDVTIGKTGSSVRLQSPLTINGALQFGSGGTPVDVLELNGQQLTLNGTIGSVPNANSGLKGDSSATLNMTGTGALGTVNFLSSFRTLSSMTMSRTSSGSVIFGNDMSVGSLALTNGIVNMGSFTLTLSGAVTRSNGWIIGNEQRTVTCSSGPGCAVVFDVGTANGYSGVSESLNVSQAGNYTQTVKAVQSQHPSLTGTNALQRYWTLSAPSGPGSASADITFNYLATDVVGTAANYKFFRYSGGTWSQLNPTGTPTTTSATINGVSSFSDWTLAEPAALNAGALQFSAANFNDSETNADHQATITVTRTGGTDGAISVHWATSAGTATAGTDYVEAFSDLNWSDGESANKTFTVTVKGDTTYEANETVNLTLSSPTNGAVLGSPNPATLTITNDDAVPPGAIFTVNTLDDNDFGACVTAHCSLREAVNAANANGDTSTITFLTGLTGTITVGSQLNLSTAMSIVGPGAGLITVSGGDTTRIFLVTATDSVSGLTLSHAFSAGGGGAFFVTSGGGNLTLTDSYLTANNAPGGAAGIFNSGVALVRNCTFAGNTANGGAAFTNNGTMTVVDTTVSGNNSAVSGPVFAIGGTLNLVNSTITNNTSDTGGGIRQFGGTINVRNTIVAGNTATSSGPDVFGSFTSQGHNLIGKSDGSSGFTNNVNGDQVGTVASPINPHLDVLGNYGGPTETHRLQSNSTAIDAGDNCVYDNSCSPAYGLSITTDQRGFLRKIDGNADNTATVDIGAFELDTAQAGTTFTVTTTDDHDDGACTSGDCTLREAINAANANADTSTINFLSSVTGNINLTGVLPTITTSTNINGPGAGVLTVRRDTGGNYRVLTISSAGTVNISGLTLSNGFDDSSGIGGVWNANTTTTLTNCTISGNSTSLNIGGLYNVGGTLNLVGCTVSGNSASIGGGGVFNQSGTTNITSSTISGNSAQAAGGVYAQNGAVNITNSTVSGNSVTGAGGGGGIIAQAGTLTVVNSTISNNASTSSGAGGGIKQTGGTTNVLNTIIAGNSAATGPDVSGSFTSQGHNLIGKSDGSTGFTNGVSNDQVGSVAIPIDPHLDVLGNYGGPTQTHRLQSGSVAINNGDNCVYDNSCSPSVGFALTTDQRGHLRKVDGVVDIGAYEFETNQTTPNFVVTNLTDVDDGACTGGDCSLREAVNAANANGDTSTITFLTGLTGTITVGSQLNLSTAMNIVGPGASVITVSGGDTTRIFLVTATDSISGLTLTHALNGGGGSAIFNNSGGGNLTLTNVYFTANQGPGGAASIFNGGVVTVMNCTFAANTGSGGQAISNNGTATFINSTVSGNTGGNVGPVFQFGGTLSVVNSTITNNSANSGGGIYTSGGTLNIRNTIVAGNSGSFQGPDVFGSFTSQGHNLIGKSDGSSGFTNNVNGDQVGTVASPIDPHLDVLGNYGGPTQTHRLQSNSTAIDAGDNCVYDNSCSPAYGLSITTDQRGAGFFRKVDGNSDANYVVDIGAYEFETANKVQFALANTNDTETDSGSHVVNIAVKRVGGAAGAMSVNYSVTDGTATTADNDYSISPSTGTLNWTDGDIADKSIAITVNGDTNVEPNETVNLALNTPGNATLGTPNTATLTIVNDDADTNVAVVSGNLTVTDTDGGNTDDTLTLTKNGSNVRISDPNHSLSCGTGATTVDAHTCDVPIASITGNIQVNTLAGNDTLTLNFANGNFMPAGGLSYAGGDPTTGPGDKLIINGGSQGTVTYNYTNAHDGSVVMSNFGTVTFTGLEPITNSGDSTDTVFNLPAGPNAVTLADDGTTSNTLSRLSGATIETTDFANPSNSLKINRGNAADTIAVNALPDFNASLTIGSAGSEFSTITFSGAVTLASNKNLAGNASGTISFPSSSSDIATSGTGTVTLTTASNITMASGSSIGVVNGDLTLNANQQVSATNGNFKGILLTNAALTTTGTGKISLNGKGGADVNTASHMGIQITSGSSVSSTQATAGAGTITLNGTGAAGTQNNRGVEVAVDTTIVTSVRGDISLTGKAGTGGLNNYGVSLLNGATVSSTGAAKITIDGTGGSGTQSNTGARVSGENTQLTSAGGDISITGHGGSGTADSHHGVSIAFGALVSATGGAKIIVDGTGGSGTSNSAGVIVSRFGPTNLVATKVTSDSGDIQFTGHGGTGSGVGQIGWNIDSKATVVATGSANITITGTGGTGTTDNYGVGFDSGNEVGTGVSAVNGNINITGVSTNTSGTDEDGVRFEDSGLGTKQAVAVTTTGSGTVTITGTAGDTDATSSGIQIVNYCSMSFTGASNSFIADTIDFGTSNVSINANANAVTLRQKTNTQAINLGGADSATQLGLTDTELDLITAGTINIGDGNSGAITVSAAISRSASTAINLTSGGAINLNASSLDSGGGNVKLTPGSSAAVDPAATSTDVSMSTTGTLSFVSGADLSIAINGTTVDNLLTGYRQLNVVGKVDLTGVDLVLSGSHTPVAGETFTIVNNDGAEAITGTFNSLGEGAIIPNFLGSSLSAKISYVGGSGNDVVLTVQAAPAPEIAVEEPPGTDLTSGSPTPIDFGSSDSGVATAAKTFTIKNIGTGDLTITGVTSDSPEFAVDTTGMLTTVTPGNSTTFKVTFTPAAPGTRNSAIHIANNDADESSFDINVTGTGNCPTGFAVNSTGDGGDANPGDGICNDGNGKCTLRAAIEEVNALNNICSGLTISFNIPANDPGHVYYKDDGIAGQVSTANVTQTSVSDDANLPTSGLLKVDPDYNHSWWRIRPIDSLPDINVGMIINGYTQGASTLQAASPNTLDLDQGDDAILRIEIDGSQIDGGTGDGFELFANDASTIKGLVINHFNNNDIYIENNGGDTISGNFIGVDVSGTLVDGTGSDGIFIDYGDGLLIGGDTPADRNLISGRGGEGGAGISISTDFTTVEGNYIGTDRTGTVALPNTFGITISGRENTIGCEVLNGDNVISGNSDTGIAISFGPNNFIQGNYIGTDKTGQLAVPNGTGVSVTGSSDNSIGIPGFGNLISGNTGEGVAINSSGNLVQSNVIGGAADGISALGNGGNGVEVYVGATNNTIGVSPVLRVDRAAKNVPRVNKSEGRTRRISAADTATGANVIAFNGEDGVRITSSGDIDNRISQNSIYSNTALGINLGIDGVTDNDVGDTDPGPNNLQNFPVLLSASSSGGSGTVHFSLDVDDSAGPFTIEFFANTTCDPTNHGEGKTYLGSTQVNGSGLDYESGSLTINPGDVITATATDASGNTSEFSVCKSAAATCPTVFTVADGTDVGDATPGDGVCETANNTCTLRAAIEEANALTSCGTIDINFATSGPMVITLGGTQLTIDHNVNINGSTADSVTVNGNGQSRVFTVNTGRTVSISNLTLTGGNGSGGNGGAIQNNGTLSLKGVTLNNNAATTGGAIRNDGALVMTNCTISGNRANGDGGGLYNAISQATLTNVTVAYNRADNDNNASGTGGGIFQISGNVLLHNTIVADNYKGPTPSTTADDLGGTMDVSSSYNLIGTGGSGLTNGTNHNQVGVTTAFLGSLINNGGVTATHGLLYNSPAIDAGDDTVLNSPLFVTTDQRSLTRPADGDLVTGSHVDIGSYERQATETRDVPNGANVIINLNDARVTFPCVPANNCGGAKPNSDSAKKSAKAIGPLVVAPSVSITDVDPSSQPAPPTGFVIGNSSSPTLPAFDISTASVTYDTPVTICFYLPVFTNATYFSGLKVFHNESNVLVNRTSSVDFANKLVCAQVNSFSPFVIGHTATPTATNGTVGGQVVDDHGNPVEGAAVRMSGSQNRLTITDAQGNYHFDNVDTNGLYVVTPSRANFTFSPSQRSFSQLGAHTEATFTAVASGGALNPLDTNEYFVRQQYLDFLGREPDESGFNFWVSNIESCGNDVGCREVKRIDTSAAFFLSIEFQQTGYLVYRAYQVAYADLPGAPVPIKQSEFKPDTQEISSGVVVLQDGWQQKLEANKQAFMAEFVMRSRFLQAYPKTMTPTEFIDKLFVNASLPLTDSDHGAAIAEFGAAADSSDNGARARVLRRIAENQTLTRQEFNQAFVLMEYFGYLRRDPNSGQDTDFSGYNFWLDKLNRFNGNFQNAEMVKAFLSSIEYRGRFPR